MPRSLLVATALLAVATSPAQTADLHCRWPAGLTRTWIGPQYYANRLQDWRISEGRLECLEARSANPLRVVHLLTAELRPKPGKLTMKVRTGVLEPDQPRSSKAWAGFLIGAGGHHVDYRLTALVHHRPAVDGGLLAVVDDLGRVSFRDNETNVHAGNLWTISGKLRDGELAEIPTTSHPSVRSGETPLSEVELSLTVEPQQGRYTLRLSATDPADGRIVSRAVLENVGSRLVDGGVGLVSHLGPEGSKFGHWFQDWTLAGGKVELHPERTFGPILCTQYTLSRGVLKLTAQMPPLGPDDTRTAELQIRPAVNGSWKTVSTAHLVADSYTIPFRVEQWDARRDTPFRMVYNLKTGSDACQAHYWCGTIRHEPVENDEFVLAAFTGNKHFTGDLRWNHDRIWFPHEELVAAVKHHDPDFLFFSGDQVYEGDITGVQRSPPKKAMLDYLDRWYRWCWTFRELTRDRPCVTIPDDHDVYHGNIWGAGGRAAKRPDDGGYIMPPAFVNMVQRTQTSHLPDPVDPKPIAQGIEVYFTRVEYAGLSFAVIEDRKFKSSPTDVVPEGRAVNGFFQNPEFDPVTQADVPGAVLLGERQLRFLSDWAVDFSAGAWMKVVLSQTLLANVATLPAKANSDAAIPQLRVYDLGEYPPDDRPVADADSGGWPQSGRNRALRAIRRGFALHVAGDQHLGSCVQYGVDGWNDAGFAFCVPSIANAWARRWLPAEPGGNRTVGMPRFAGQYRDGFGNYVSVHAVANPHRSGREPARLYDHVPGYGIVRFRRSAREIVLECWPRWVDPSAPDAVQYAGWPITIHQWDNYRRVASGYLPEIAVQGLQTPVIHVVADDTGEVVYALRNPGPHIRPWVFRQGTYAVEVGDPDTGRWKRLSALQSSSKPQASISVTFD